MAKMCFTFISVLLVNLYMSPNAGGAKLEDGEQLNQLSDIDEYMMPDSCAGKTFCFDKGENYPYEKIGKLLENMRELKVETPEEGPKQSVEDRVGDSPDEPDCSSDFSNSPIFYIVDTNNNTRVVVQSVEKFQQIYMVKWCKNEGRITNDTPHFLKNTLKSFKIECINTKMNFDFFVLKEDSEGLKMEIVQARDGIPVCCRCRYSDV